MYILTFIQVLPYKVLKTFYVRDFEKAFKLGEKWIEVQKDSYCAKHLEHHGPDFYYNIVKIL